MIYRCLVCGKGFRALSDLISHFAEHHPDLLPGWYWVLRYEGRRPGLWRVYRELRIAGLARGGKR